MRLKTTTNNARRTGKGENSGKNGPRNGDAYQQTQPTKGKGRGGPLAYLSGPPILLWETAERRGAVGAGRHSWSPQREEVTPSGHSSLPSSPLIPPPRPRSSVRLSQPSSLSLPPNPHFSPTSTTSPNTTSLNTLLLSPEQSIPESIEPILLHHVYQKEKERRRGACGLAERERGGRGVRSRLVSPTPEQACRRRLKLRRSSVQLHGSPHSCEWRPLCRSVVARPPSTSPES